MGILTDDENLVDAALSEIVVLPLEQRHQRDPRRDVDYLLMQYHLAQVSNAIQRKVYWIMALNRTFHVTTVGRRRPSDLSRTKISAS